MASRRGAVKQKATDKLAEAFKDTSNNAEGLAIEIESAMETMLGPSSPQFQSKLRDIVYNVKRNDGLRASVARGRVSPEELVRMDAYAMALPCEQRAAEEQQEKNISIEKTLPKQLLEVEESAGIKCSNCGSPHVAVQRKGHMDEWSGVREVQCQECGYMETRED